MDSINLENYMGLCWFVIVLLIGLKKLILVIRFKNNYKAMQGISLGTEVTSICSSVVAMEYGKYSYAHWIIVVAIINLVVTSYTIILKLRIERINKENQSTLSSTYEANKSNAWVSYDLFKQLSNEDKEIFLKNLYSTGLIKQLKHELLNPISYEDMSTLDKMYWNKELWDDYCKDKDRG